MPHRRPHACAPWHRCASCPMTSGQHAEQPRGKASGTEARRSRTHALHGGDRSRPGGIFPGRARATARSGLRLRQHCRDMSVGFEDPDKQVLRLNCARTICSRPSLAIVAAIPMTVMLSGIAHAWANLMWGNRWRSGVRRSDDGMGAWIFTAVEHWISPSVRPWRARPGLRPALQPISIAGLDRAADIGSTAAGAGSRGWPADAMPRLAQSAVVSLLLPTRCGLHLGITALSLRLRRRAPDQRIFASGSIAR